jgi:DNA-binding GntR family transcriptional regulator
VAVPEPAANPLPAPLVRHPTLPDAVLADLRGQLIRGRFAPGDPIRVDAVADELQVSVIPVREALRVLLAEGRVEYVPHRGYRVTTLSYEEIEEMFLICRLLEREALRRGIPAMDEAAVVRMGALLDRLEDGSDEVWSLVAAHRDFHFVPMECADVPRLVSTIRQLWDSTAHYRTLGIFGDGATYGAMQAEHRAIFDACAARDATRAIALMDRHRRHVLARMRRAL